MIGKAVQIREAQKVLPADRQRRLGSDAQCSSANGKIEPYLKTLRKKHDDRIEAEQKAQVLADTIQAQPEPIQPEPPPSPALPPMLGAILAGVREMFSDLIAEAAYRGMLKALLELQPKPEPEPVKHEVKITTPIMRTVLVDENGADMSASSSKAAKKKLLVIGLNGHMMDIIKREFGPNADLRFCDAQIPSAELRSKLHHMDHALLMLKFISHGTQEVLNQSGVKYAKVSGGITMLRDALENWIFHGRDGKSQSFKQQQHAH